MPINEDTLEKFRLVVDIVVSPPTTRLLQISQSKKIATVDGLTIALKQSFAQFYLYTGIEPPQEVMARAAQSLIVK